MYIISSIHILIINSIFSYSFQFANNISACDYEGLTELLKSEGAGSWCLLDCWCLVLAELLCNAGLLVLAELLCNA